MTKRTKPSPARGERPADERPTPGQKEHERQLKKRPLNGATEQGSQRAYSKSDYREETRDARKRGH